MRRKEAFTRRDNNSRRYDEFSVMIITVCDIQFDAGQITTNIRLAASAAIS